MLDIQVRPCGSFQSNSYLVSKPGMNEALLIDAGDDYDGLRDLIDRSGKTVQAILLTHGHFDHMLGAGRLREQYGMPFYIHPDDQRYLTDATLSLEPNAFMPCPTEHFYETEKNGEGMLSLIGLDITVMHTPGHTPGSVCLYFEPERAVFTGDTLFRHGYGRTDLTGGSMHQLIPSLRRVLALPRDVYVYPGHEDGAEMAVIRGDYR